MAMNNCRDQGVTIHIRAVNLLLLLRDIKEMLLVATTSTVVMPGNLAAGTLLGVTV